MHNIEEIYRNLTNVDIVQQKVLWDERGRGYYGEFLVFCELYSRLPGTCKLLMNLNVPTRNGKTTEIDLLLLHETGVYVFEIKHYKGTIYGKPHEPTWTQYFRTVKNHVFRSPVEQNQYHIRALRDMFPDLPIRSYIVFTSTECDLKVECNEPDISICTLSVLYDRLSVHTARPAVMDMLQINQIFCALLPYSPHRLKTVCINETEVPFYEYISALRDDYLEKANKLEADYLVKMAVERKECQTKVHKAETSALYEQMEAKKQKKIAVFFSVVACLACIISIIVCSGIRKDSARQISEAQQKLIEIEQKYGSAERDNLDPSVLENIVSVSKCSLETIYGVNNAVSFSCTLVWTGQEYGIGIGKDAVLIMTLLDGTTRECPVFNEQYVFQSDLLLGSSASANFTTYSDILICPLQFNNVSVRDIASIKLSDVYLWHDVNNQPSKVSKYEVEVYRGM